LNASELEDEWVPLMDACLGTPYSQEYLSLLARLGRIEATIKESNWYTTRRAVKAYQSCSATISSNFE